MMTTCLSNTSGGTLRGAIPAELLDELFNWESTVTQPVELVKLNADPNGIDQHAPGAKLDAGKTDVGLLWESFPNALTGVAMVATFGANKYTRNGWKEVPQGRQRYAAAEGRHKLERFKGFVNDEESGLPHQFHEVWNALAQLELWYTGKGE